MKLPEKSVDFESTTKLFAATHQLFVSNGFSANAASAATHFSFAACFADVLPVAPCLLITGPKLEADFLLDLLACVVRHPLPISEFTPRALCSLPMQLRPTLLINAEQITRSSIKLLRTSNRKHALLSSKGNLVNVYCAKAWYCGQIADAYGIDESALHVGLLPASRRLPILDRKHATVILVPDHCARTRRSLGESSASREVS